VYNSRFHDEVLLCHTAKPWIKILDRLILAVA
jgi:hypothetical protein